MAKKDKAAKSKFANKAEAKTELGNLKETRKSAREELRAYEKENELDKDADNGKDKKWAKLKKAYDDANGKVETLEAEIKEMPKSTAVRASKYDYPKSESGKEMTAGEKKRYRAKMRAEAAKSAKGETKGEGKKSGKKKGGKKEAEAPATEGKKGSSKGGNAVAKKKKKPVAEPVED
jgi:hypothetical protein